MPQQNRDAINDLALKIARHIDAMPSENPQGPTPEEKDTLKGAVMIVAGLASNFDRVADACERIAQALEDEHKIHAPQLKPEYPALRTCPICGLVLPRPECLKTDCPNTVGVKPCPACSDIAHDCGKSYCPQRDHTPDSAGG